MDNDAGIKLLKEVKKMRFDIPLLLTSSEPSNAIKAAKIPASFVDKNSDSLHSDVRSFFVNYTKNRNSVSYTDQSKHW